MTLRTGQTIAQGNFILRSEKNATPSNDADRVPRLETDGKVHTFFTRMGEVLQAGATINGATLPVPVYQNKTDNELYACDANDLTALKFIGFAISNSTNGNPIDFQGCGIVGGFSGLDEGEKYYVQDAVGTIGTSPGTYEVLVGVAISTTQLLIQKGGRFLSGTASFSSSTSTAVTLGFRPTFVRVHMTYSNSTGTNGHSTGSWSPSGGQNCSWRHLMSGQSPTTDQAGTSTDKVWYCNTDTDDPESHVGTITSITDTGFTLTNVKSSTAPNIHLYWEAEGEL